jgi:hypothetical protein
MEPVKTSDAPTIVVAQNPNPSIVPITGLHTPAESASSVILPKLAEAKEEPESIIAQLARLAELRQRHHALSKSVSELQWQNADMHARKLSQTGRVVQRDARALVHERLNSLPPVFIPSGKRIVSTIGCIAEEPEGSNERQPDCLPNQYCNQLSATPWASVSLYDQHFYDNFNAPDFSMLPVQMQPLATPYNHEFGPHGFADVFMNGLGSPETQYVNVGGSVDFHAQGMQPPFDFSLQHAQTGSSASDFILPQRESKAVPIVRPASAQEEDHEAAETTATYDAYDGFDSASDMDESSDQQEDSHDDFQEGANDERVKAFVFPNAKSAPATPSIARTALYDSVDMTRSASPIKRHQEELMFLQNLTSGTPQKSPARRIFNKSVGMADAELDSVIRGLTQAQEASSPVAEDNLEDSDVSMSSMSSGLMSSPPLMSMQRPPLALRRVDGQSIAPERSISGKQLLLLNHQDADLGLLLDKMLTTKLAGVFEAVQSIQDGISSLEQQVATSLDQSALSGQVSELTEALQDARTALDVRDAKIEGLEETVDVLHEQLAELECSAAETSVCLPAVDVSSSQEDAARLEDMMERVRVLEGARSGLQLAVRDGTLKRAQQDAQYRDLETTLQGLRSESAAWQDRAECAERAHHQAIEETQRVQASEASIVVKHGKLQQELQEAAVSIAQEQSRWLATESALRAQAQEADARAMREVTARQKLEAELERLRRVERASLVPTDVNILKAQVAMLEHQQKATTEGHQAELAMRDGRLDRMMSEWQEMAKRLAAAEQKASGAAARAAMMPVLPDDPGVSFEGRDAAVLARTEWLLQSMQQMMQQQQQQQGVTAKEAELAHRAEVAQLKAHARRVSNSQAAHIAELEQAVAATEVSATRGLRVREREIGRQRGILETITSNVEVMHSVNLAQDKDKSADPKAAMQKSTEALRRIRLELEQAARTPAPRLVNKATSSTASADLLAGGRLAQVGGAVAQLDAAAAEGGSKQRALAQAMASLIGGDSPGKTNRR